jgi:hypothetical protein
MGRRLGKDTFHDGVAGESDHSGDRERQECVNEPQLSAVDWFT